MTITTKDVIEIKFVKPAAFATAEFHPIYYSPGSMVDHYSADCRFLKQHLRNHNKSGPNIYYKHNDTVYRCTQCWPRVIQIEI